METARKMELNPKRFLWQKNRIRQSPQRREGRWGFLKKRTSNVQHRTSNLGSEGMSPSKIGQKWCNSHQFNRSSHLLPTFCNHSHPFCYTAFLRLQILYPIFFWHTRLIPLFFSLEKAMSEIVFHSLKSILDFPLRHRNDPQSFCRPWQHVIAFWYPVAHMEGYTGCRFKTWSIQSDFSVRVSEHS